MGNLKKSAISNIVGLCFSILLAHLSSLRIMYDGSYQHTWDVITIVMVFFGIKYITVLLIDFIFKNKRP